MSAPALGTHKFLRNITLNLIEEDDCGGNYPGSFGYAVDVDSTPESIDILVGEPFFPDDSPGVMKTRGLAATYRFRPNGGVLPSWTDLGATYGDVAGDLFGSTVGTGQVTVVVGSRTAPLIDMP